MVKRSEKKRSEKKRSEKKEVKRKEFINLKNIIYIFKFIVIYLYLAEQKIRLEIPLNHDIVEGLQISKSQIFG